MKTAVLDFLQSVGDSKISNKKIFKQIHYLNIQDNNFIILK